jgi:hypothetical protein
MRCPTTLQELREQLRRPGMMAALPFASASAVVVTGGGMGEIYGALSKGVEVRGGTRAAWWTIQ